MPNLPPYNVKLLRYKHVRELIPVDTSTIWRWVKEGTFPAPIQLNPGVPNSPVAWVEADVLAWRDERMQHRGYGLQPPCVEGLAHRAAVNRRHPKVYHFTRRAPLPPGYWKSLPEAE